MGFNKVITTDALCPECKNNLIVFKPAKEGNSFKLFCEHCSRYEPKLFDNIAELKHYINIEKEILK